MQVTVQQEIDFITVRDRPRKFQKYLQIIKETRYETRHPLDPLGGADATTYGRRSVTLSQSWFRFNTAERSSILIHESKHCEQAGTSSNFAWWIYYLFNKKRLEKEAYDLAGEFLRAI